MEFFKNLEIEGGSKLNECLRLIGEGAEKLGWERDRAQEKDYLKDVKQCADVEETHCIKYPGNKSLPAATIWMIKNNTCIKVTNIIPVAPIRELTKGQYNAILDEFDAQIVQRAIKETGVSKMVSVGDKSLEQILGSKIADFLKSFSALANKSTGSAHPCDRDRWFEFIIASHVDEANIATEDLARWLEEDGWRDEKVICDLACEYEFSRGLLKAFEKSKKKSS